jgi:hypothetical protein
VTDLDLDSRDRIGLNRIRAGLAHVAAAGEPPPDPSTPAGRATLQAAILAADAERITRPRPDADGWAGIAMTPARGDHRRTAILRLTGKLLADGVDPYLAGALIHSHNRARCIPPLPVAEVDSLIEWTCHRHADALEHPA